MMYIVRKKEGKRELGQRYDGQYGLIQTSVFADTPEEAKATGASILGVEIDDVEVHSDAVLSEGGIDWGDPLFESLPGQAGQGD